MIKLALSPEQSGYSANDSIGAVHIPLEGGRSAVYADVLGASAIVDVTWVLDPDQYEELVQFYRVQLRNGVDRFLFDLILDESLPTEYEVQFLPNTFQLVSQSGFTYTVAAQLEVTPSEMYELTDIFILATYPDRYVVPALERLVNIVMPENIG